jgi:hypothetical protein
MIELPQDLTGEPTPGGRGQRRHRGGDQGHDDQGHDDQGHDDQGHDDHTRDRCLTAVLIHDESVGLSRVGEDSGLAPLDGAPCPLDAQASPAGEDVERWRRSVVAFSGAGQLGGPQLDMVEP